jgi:L-malate glycosyltransferase
MKKLCIAFLSAGRFTHIGPYIDFFKSRGHEVFLIKYDYSEKTFGVQAYDISHGARGDKQDSKWKYLLAGVSIRKVLREIRPDILHGHYITSAGVISWMSGFSPYILTAHGSDVIGSMKSWLWRQILPRVLAKAALVNPVSEDLAVNINTLGVPQEKMFVSTYGVDTEKYYFDLRIPDGKPWKLLCTRTLADVYDPETILKACKKLKDRGLCLEMTFAANGPMLDGLRQAARQENIIDYVKFTGGYDNADLPKLLHANDFFISASLWDGTSISLLEAMAAGIFPVVSRIAANSALLEEGKSALMFDCGNENQLVDMILRAINDNHLRQSAVQINRRCVEEKADRMKNMLALEKIYYDICGESEA